MAPQQTGYQIGGRFYPAVETFKLGDPILIQEITRLEWDEFVERLPSDEEIAQVWFDPVLRAALVGVAVARGNPNWRLEKVVRYIRGLDMDDVELVGPEDDEEDQTEDAEEGERRPPAEEKSKGKVASGGKK